MKIKALAEMLGRQDVDGLGIRLGLSAMKDVKIADNKTGKETAPIRDSWTPGRDEDRFFKDKVWDEDGWQITCKT